MESSIQQLLQLLSPIQQFLKLPVEDNSTIRQSVKALNELTTGINQQIKLLLQSSTKLSGSVGFPDQCDNKPEDIALVQLKLNIKVTGFYNEETEKAIENYQRSIGFQKPDGVISPTGRTFNKMQEEPITSIEFSEDEVDVIYGQTTDTLNISGSVGEGGKNESVDVRVIQTLLDIDVTGDCDSKTKNEIKEFQEDYEHLVNDGRVDVGGATWQQLIEEHKEATARKPVKPIDIETISIPLQPVEIKIERIDVPPIVSSAPSRQELTQQANIIKESVGKNGVNLIEDVELVQRLLDIKETGKLDGRTIRNIKRFQRQKMDMRPPSGIIYPDDFTWAALMEHQPKENIISTETPQDTDSTAPILKDDTIISSVGNGGVNEKNDVIKIKMLLSEKWGFKIATNSSGKFDQTVDEAFKHAIEEFQYRYAGSIYTQDGRVDPNGTTWKYLTGRLKPVMEKTESGILGGVETKLEKEMAEFTKKFSGITVTLKSGEIVTVRPPYHINMGGRMKRAIKARKANPKVTSVISSLGWGSSFGKASPKQIETFLQTCIDKNYIPSKLLNSKGLHKFLALYGVSTDCSGLAIQAANFLLEGNLDRTNGNKETVKYTNTHGIQQHPKVATPTKLQAGDMMVNYKRKGTSTYHVRVIVDVDLEGDSIAFTTVESGSDMSLGADGHGVGQRRWKFPNKTTFENLKILKGNQWEHASKSDQAYTYVRLRQMAHLDDN